MRECLVDGDVNGETLEAFFKNRAEFIASYDGFEEAEYFETTVPEINKIASIPDGSIVNLWFEDDLFCQVNFWFVCDFLLNIRVSVALYYVRPPQYSKYGFGGVSPEELPQLLDNGITIENEELAYFASLWNAYQHQDLETFKTSQNAPSDKYPFLAPAFQALIDKIEQNAPEKIIQDIIKETKSKEFGPVFREFCNRAPVYGFGDLQVKRIFDSLINT